MNNKKDKHSVVPIAAGLLLAVLFGVLAATGVLPVIVNSISSFMEGGPSVGPVMWGVIGIGILGAYYLSQNKKER